MRASEKKFAALLAALLLFAVLPLSGCRKIELPPFPRLSDYMEEQASKASEDGTGVADLCNSPDGLYPVAMVPVGGELKDGGMNESVWRGVKTCAHDRGEAYKYYIPPGAEETDNFTAMREAAEAGARIVVCTGLAARTAITHAASVYPEVMFVNIGGGVSDGLDGDPLPNSAGVLFDELACGYLAGWAAVAEGCTELGFCGAGGGRDESSCLCGYGFVQGANAAAEKLDVDVRIKYTWMYGAAYSACDGLEELLKGWYESGTQLVLPCGGTLFDSAVAAAEQTGGRVAGLNTDRSGASGAVLFSVVKSGERAAYRMVDAFLAGNWSELGGKDTGFGLTDGAFALSTGADRWQLERFTAEDCQALLERGAAGRIVPDKAYPEADGETMRERDFSNVKVTVIS